jgi:HAMP domain-containing protein/HPt (histidine-containing phosphotransfer) domain-containing protein
MCVLGAVAVLLAWELSERELGRLVASKRAAGEMLADVVARDLSAPLEFTDDEAIDRAVDRLAQSPQVSHVSVFSDGKRVATFNGEPGEAAPAFANVVVNPEAIEIARMVMAPGPHAVGAIRLVLSLRDENAEHRSSRLRILGWSTVLGVATAAALILSARRQVVIPLQRLAAAAVRIGAGQQGHVTIDSNDELGDLGEAFNAMSASIRDRERRLDLARQNLRDLFDHMRQAIVAFGPDGKIRGATSRQAHVLFGEEDLEGRPVRSLLFPHVTEYDVDAQAFDEWLTMAFSSKPEEWHALERFAPSEVRLPRGEKDAIPVVLEFRPVVRGGTITHLMLLATDVSAERALEKRVEAQELAHERRLAAMRRLVAGGTHLFVRFVESSRDRVEACQALLPEPGARIATSTVDELFRHVHTIKGEARAFDLPGLERSAGALEDELDAIRAAAREDGYPVDAELHARLHKELGDAITEIDRSRDLFAAASPVGNAVFDQITVRQTDLDALVSEVGERAGPLGAIVRRLASRPLGESAAAVLDAIDGWAESERKEVQVVVEGREQPIPGPLARVLPGVLTHLVRNAVAHGIEAPEEREASGKPRVGTVRILGGSGDVAVVVEDDGRGVDEDLVLARAESMHIRRGDSKDLIFEPGLSTRARVDAMAGRGVGLDAVRSALAGVGYSVSFERVDGKLSRFTVCARSSSLARVGT